MNKKSQFYIFFIIAFTFFLLGSLFSQSLGQDGIFSMGKTETASQKSVSDEKKSSQTVENELDMSKYFEVYDILQGQYYDAEEIDTESLIDSSIAGMLEGLDDPHSEYLSKEENKNFQELLDGDFEGIGAVVEKVDFGVQLDSIFAGSGAEEAGLLQGDIVLSVDEESVVDMDLIDAIKKIKGPAGTKVELEILREGELEPLFITVTRKRIDIPSVEFEVFDGNIGYLAINSFGEKTADDVLGALIEMKETDGLIIDLRNNGGGYLQSAVEMLSDFIENGKLLVTTKIKGDKIEEQLKSTNSGNIYDKKIIVLINENSASASEIVAGALGEYDKAILVGKKSYGKGSVQAPIELPDGSMVKLTVAKWFTPNDVNIDKEGIQPDLEVDFKREDYLFTACQEAGKCSDEMQEADFEGFDRQLEVAKKLLALYIEKDARQLSVDLFREQYADLLFIKK